MRLFERGGCFPVLTAEGKALLPDARTVAGSMDLFKARARGLAGGLEPEVSVVVDVMFPSTIYPTDSPPGPAGRWLIDRLTYTAERMSDGAFRCTQRRSGG